MVCDSGAGSGKMLKSQRKALCLLVVLLADIGMCSTQNRPMVQYKWTDLHAEKQGIFTGALNNHSILAFKIKDYYPTHCTTYRSDILLCHRKHYHIRAQVPLHESNLPPFDGLCEVSPKMAFDQLPLQTRSELLNTTAYMIVWSIKVPTRSCLVLRFHVNSSDSSLSNGEGNRLYLEDHKGRHDVVRGDTFEHHIQNWNRRTPKMAKVVYVQKSHNETIDFNFTAQKTQAYSCACTRYYKRALPQL